MRILCKSVRRRQCRDDHEPECAQTCHRRTQAPMPGRYVRSRLLGTFLFQLVSKHSRDIEEDNYDDRNAK